jgi:hypothetical protein
VKLKLFLLLWLVTLGHSTIAQPIQLDKYNVVWNSPSRNSSESMPCGGGDIGLNVWVENGDVLFYIAKSGFFDENNGLMKAGRIRLRLNPNPFDGGTVRQELKLKDGFIEINGSKAGLKAQLKIWVDVFRPVVHVDLVANSKIVMESGYETWRYADREVRKTEGVANSYKWVVPEGLKTRKDEISFENNTVLFLHRNEEPTIFDLTVRQQGMDPVKDQLFNPLRNLTFGGTMMGDNMIQSGNYEGKYLDTDYMGWLLKSKLAAREQSLAIFLIGSQTESLNIWKEQLRSLVAEYKNTRETAFLKTRDWWHQFWNRSFVFITNRNDSTSWSVGRNYQLFRYMLACNAYGEYPTKFNGGLFTADPVFTDTARHFTPDFRNWGGGTFTAQNQRLVYFPMLKSGDFDLLKPQFDFYLRILKNAELRSEVYWHHKGACFTEQMENFGLPNLIEYGWERPVDFDKGMEYNAWLEYEWDTSLEFCLMMLETERFTGKDITSYIPFIESCLTFFDEHYQYLARLRGIKKLDAEGHLILYPGSACETYKMATNSTSTIAGLTTILKRLLELPAGYLTENQKEKLQAMLKRIPPISTRICDGFTTIAPAKSWERINNVEVPQLYPVFPWGIYGFGKPDLELALNTWNHDPDAIKNRSHIGWKQDNIFAACLGLTKEAARLNFLKLQDSGRRFPAFWGPGFDWVPDHNWGGAGMIGIQEMLLQVDGNKMHLFPAWPKNIDVHFKLNAPRNTTVEASLKDGKIEFLKVFPEERRKDIVSIFQE